MPEAWLVRVALSELQALEAGLEAVIVAFLFILASGASLCGDLLIKNARMGVLPRLFVDSGSWIVNGRFNDAGIDGTSFGVLKQLSCFFEHGIDAVECADLLVRDAIHMLPDLTHFELNGILSLLKLHQPLRQRSNRLGQILRSTGDPK